MAKVNTANVARNNTQVALQQANTAVQASGQPNAGKYAAKTAKLGGAAVVPSFKYSGMALHCNTAPNTAPQKPTTVMGVLYGMVKANPGITGAKLTALMLAHQWQGHPTAYIAGGKVCALWCQGYIVGAVSNKHKHLVASAVPQAPAAPAAK